jgi:hypothetical protein
MIGYKEVSRVDLGDGEGCRLSIILTYNQVSWKLYSEHEVPGEELRRSAPWHFVREPGAREYLDKKVAEAEAAGWRRET